MEEEPKRGRGRPAGSMNKLARDAIAAANATGLLLPHEILLRIANGLAIRREQVDGLQRIHVTYTEVTVDMQMDAAKAAAPYYAPKIATVEVIQGVSDEDLDAIIAGAAAEAGISLGADGEGQESEEAGSGEPEATGTRRRKTFSL